MQTDLAYIVLAQFCVLSAGATHASAFDAWSDYQVQIPTARVAVEPSLMTFSSFDACNVSPNLLFQCTQDGKQPSRSISNQLTGGQRSCQNTSIDAEVNEQVDKIPRSQYSGEYNHRYIE